MNNQIIGNVHLENAHIEFKGNNNIFFCTNNLNLENCRVRFTGNNSLIYIDDNSYPLSLNILIISSSVTYSVLKSS